MSKYLLSTKVYVALNPSLSKVTSETNCNVRKFLEEIKGAGIWEPQNFPPKSDVSLLPSAIWKKREFIVAN